MTNLEEAIKQHAIKMINAETPHDKLHHAKEIDSLNGYNMLNLSNIIHGQVLNDLDGQIAAQNHEAGYNGTNEDWKSEL